MTKTNFVQNIFDPVVQFLDRSITQLNAMTTISMKGVRLDNYFGVFGILGPDWTRTISTFLTCFLFIFILWTIKNYSRILLWFKALVKWW